MRIHLQPNVLRFETQLVQQRRVLLGRENVDSHRIGRNSTVTERRQKWFTMSDVVGNCVRRHVGIRWHLYRELPAWAQRRSPPPNHSRMIRYPLQRRVRKHKIVIAIARPLADVAMYKRDIACAVLRCLGQHRRRVVDALHLSNPELRHSQTRQLTGAASEVDSTHHRRRADQRK